MGNIPFFCPPIWMVKRLKKARACTEKAFALALKYGPLAVYLAATIDVVDKFC